MFEDDIPKYRKRAKKTGLPRAKHKHEYETVLLTTEFKNHSVKTGLIQTFTTEKPTKVCKICGRIDHVDNDPKWYFFSTVKELPVYVKEKLLSAEALDLPKWKCKFLDKFATPLEEKDD